jgi:hypothetical protein
VVALRIARDPFEGVDRAQAGFERLPIVELVDRFSEALSDPAFSAQPKLPPRRDGADEEQQTSHALEKGRPHIVLSLHTLGRWQMLSRAEVTINEEPREDKHAHQQQDKEANRKQGALGELGPREWAHGVLLRGRDSITPRTY